MKSQISSLCFSIALAATVVAGPDVKLPKSEDAGLLVDRSQGENNRLYIQKPSDLKALREAMKLAKPIDRPASSNLLKSRSHFIRFENAWLYNEKTGNITLFSKRAKQIYKIRKEDRKEFNRILNSGMVIK